MISLVATNRYGVWVTPPLLSLSIAVFTMCAVGCGDGFFMESPNSRMVPPGLKERVREFERRYDIYVDYPIRWRNKIAPVEGKCHSNDPVRKRVYLRRSYWKNVGDRRRTALLYHELGHCSLYLEHDKKTFPNEEPYSLMHPYDMPSQSWWKDKKQHYFRELEEKFH